MKLWIDDCRPAPKDYDHHVATAAQAIDLIKKGGVTVISFDHDLGTHQGTGYDVAKFIAQEAYHSRMRPVGWTVHSANPVGRSNIIETMKQADKYWRRNGLL